MSRKNKIPISRKYKFQWPWIISIIVISLFSQLLTAKAQGSLIVMPKRFVFDGVKRTLQLNLGNSTNDSAQYIISVIEMRMTPNGSFEEIKVADTNQKNGATGYIRVFPRYVTLGPNEAQTIKVQLITKNKLTNGEYRSHILIKAAPKGKPDDHKKLEKMVTDLAVKLTPVFSITIPVIIRIGPYDATLSFSDLSFKKESSTNSDPNSIPQFYANLNRTGTMSIYGNLSIEHISNEGLATHVGFIKGVAVYSPNTTRKIQVNLADNLSVDYNKGKLHVTFSTQIEDRFVKMAESILPLE